MLARHRTLVVVAALFVVSCLVASCGGGSSGTAASPAASASSATHGDATAYQQFQDAATRFAALPAYAVTYNARVNNPAGASFSAAVAFTHKGSVTRVQLDGTVNGKETHFATIQDGSTLTLCQSPTSSCIRTTADKANANPLSSLDPVGILKTVAADPSMTIAPAAQQTFAGIAGACYTVTQQTQKSTFCVDPATGILLLAVGQSTAATGTQPFTESIAATAVSTAVTAVDTSTPYPLATS